MKSLNFIHHCWDFIYKLNKAYFISVEGPQAHSHLLGLLVFTLLDVLLQIVIHQKSHQLLAPKT